MIANITQENLHLGYKAKNKAEVLTLLGEEFKRKATSAKTAPLFLMKGNVRCPLFRQWHYASAPAEIRDQYHSENRNRNISVPGRRHLGQKQRHVYRHWRDCQRERAY